MPDQEEERWNLLPEGTTVRIRILMNSKERLILH